MQTLSKPKIYSAEEKKKIIENYDESRMLKKDYCTHIGISVSALYRWEQKYKSTTKCENVAPFSKQAFTPLNLFPSNSANTEQQLKIKLLNGIETYVPHGFDVKYLSVIVKELSKCY